jgi:hypothetical protein
MTKVIRYKDMVIQNGPITFPKDTSNAEKLLRRGLKFLPDYIGYMCGNCEGTPCDDMQPSYVCAAHYWLADVRRELNAPMEAE